MPPGHSWRYGTAEASVPRSPYAVACAHGAGTGLVYMVTWVNYGPQKSSKWLAASVPALMTLRFAGTDHHRTH